MSKENIRTAWYLFAFVLIVTLMVGGSIAANEKLQPQPASNSSSAILESPRIPTAHKPAPATHVHASAELSSIPVKVAPKIKTTPKVIPGAKPPTVTEPVVSPPVEAEPEITPPPAFPPVWYLLDNPTALPDCPTEDSINCFWNSGTMGNGWGMSFINVNGVTYYL